MTKLPAFSTSGNGLCAIGRCLSFVLGIGVLFIVRFMVAIVAGVFALVFVVVVVIGRAQIDGVQGHTGNLRIHLREDVAGAAERLLGGLSRTDDQYDGIGPRRQHNGIGTERVGGVSTTM